MNLFLLLLLVKDIVEESQKLVDSLDKLRVSAASSSSNFKKKPIIIIVVGMAGNFIFTYVLENSLCQGVSLV